VQAWQTLCAMQYPAFAVVVLQIPSAPLAVVQGRIMPPVTQAGSPCPGWHAARLSWQTNGCGGGLVVGGGPGIPSA
jgi:hypothetical protein